MSNAFRLKIELGNAAMLTREDVAQALDEVAQNLRDGIELGNIRDINGNKVGSFGGDFEDEDEDADED